MKFVKNNPDYRVLLNENDIILQNEASMPSADADADAGNELPRNHTVNDNDAGVLRPAIIGIISVPLVSYVILLIVGLVVFPLIFKSMFISPWPVCEFSPGAQQDALRYKVKGRSCKIHSKFEGRRSFNHKIGLSQS